MPTCPRAPCCGGFEAAKKPEMQPLIQEVEREVGASAIGACQHNVSISSSKKDLQPKKLEKGGMMGQESSNALKN